MPSHSNHLLHHFLENSASLYPDRIALVCNNEAISYRELEVRTNQLAYYLASQNLKAGQVIGIFLERSIECYLSILAILKLGAAYVPIEVEYPDERVNFIFEDLPFAAILTSSNLFNKRDVHWPKSILLDQELSIISQQNTQRFIPDVEITGENLAYIIYTSGSTGKPKGVEITHQSISHYVREASKIYQMSADDRVYQGYSLAFDASLEELWMAFANGASLIACTSKEIRSGVGLVSFMQQHKITVFSSVPTLAATLEGPWSDLRLLLLGGESCPATLVDTWSRPGLRILNTYGPTEASVIATYSECYPDREITIGHPVPGYTVFLLNENFTEVPDGQVGELCIGGPALARGYVNRAEITREKFITHPQDVTLRLYRTGDLAYKTESGELQFAGRLDDQIKLRGFRIELNEIEAVMMTFKGVAQAVVILQKTEQPFLAAYLRLDKNSTFELNQFKQFIKKNLPDYMAPAAVEIVDNFPLLTSGKVDRKALPKPQTASMQREYVAPNTALEKEITAIWETVFKTSKLSVDADFFYDLGGQSLLAAQVISKMRQLPQLRDISILDLYQNPTIVELAKLFKTSEEQSHNKVEEKKREKYRAPAWKYYLCGFGQLFGILFQYAIGSWQLMAVYLLYFLSNATSLTWSRELELGCLYLFLLVPFLSISVVVTLKWLLLGRVKPGVYPLWGWFYYRWWLVTRLVYNSFFHKLMLGTPLISVYYRLLGAKIGKNCFIATKSVFFFDQFKVGDNASIGIDVKMNGYIVENGWLKIGAIDIGEDTYIGSRSVIGINTQIADKVILEEMSMVPDNTSLPSGYYIGTPVRKATIPGEHVTRTNKKNEDNSILDTASFGFLHYLGIICLILSNIVCILPGFMFIDYFYTQSSYWLTILATPIGAVLSLGVHYLYVIAVKKCILNKMEPGVYSLKSFHYLRYWFIKELIDNPSIAILSDSIYLPMLYRRLGAKLGSKVEMGEVHHTIPDLLTIEEGGFAASSVAIGWGQVYLNSLYVAPVTIGKKAFVGNVSVLSAGKTIGDGGLLGCLSLTPTENQSSETGSCWLGAPAIYLPKREIFSGYSDATTYNPSKKLYFTRAVIELIRIIIPTTYSFVVMYNLFYLLEFMIKKYSILTVGIVLPVFELCIVGLLSLSLVGLKRILIGKLLPMAKPLWDIFIWKSDLVEFTYGYFICPNFMEFALGSPYALLVARCFGSKIGKRVFCDTEGFAEFDLIEIGDEVCINRNSLLQTHLFEDRVFKMSSLNIKSGCNVGVGSVVLYNTLMEENASLGNLSLLMKGEYLPANSEWAGIPAQSVSLSNQNRLKWQEALDIKAVEVPAEVL